MRQWSWCGGAIPKAWIALGCNLGDRELSLRRALRAMGELGRIDEVTKIYETEPVGLASQPSFLNAVVSLTTEFGAGPLLERLLAVELELGRRRGERNGPREIDLDLLLYDGLVIREPGLEVPHPRLPERRFVLAPLAEIAPELVHPILGRTMSELLQELPEGEWVREFGTLT